MTIGLQRAVSPACPAAVLVVLAFLSGPFATAPARAQGASLAELAMYSGPDRTERLIAGAKREGQCFA